MKYANRELKVDQWIDSFNGSKISLMPPFQRGTVWSLPMRQRLICNMLKSRPIPAVFLYKDPEGSQFSYNILDGKQRLETLILFVGNKRADKKVERLQDYFFGQKHRKVMNFKVHIDGKLRGFADLDDEMVRVFKEFAIPTIEIDMDDDRAASLDELTNLFADINSYGKKVDRFHVVKVMSKQPLIGSLFRLIAVEQKRGKTRRYKLMQNDITFVLKRLEAIKRLSDNQSRVDRIWERLVELVLYLRTRTHRAPVQILGNFLKEKAQDNEALTKSEIAALRKTFSFLANAYRKIPFLARIGLATDQPAFYTIATMLLTTNMIDKFGQDQLTFKLARTAYVLLNEAKFPDFQEQVKTFWGSVVSQTTHPKSRRDRERVLTEIISKVSGDPILLPTADGGPPAQPDSTE